MGITRIIIIYRLDVKGCKQNLLPNLPGKNRSSSAAFQLLSQTPQKPSLDRRTSQTTVAALKIVRSVSRESIHSTTHHCTCSCLNAQVTNSKTKSNKNQIRKTNCRCEYRALTRT